MQITNRFNLPGPIVKAVVNDPYTKGGADYSATELIAPVQQTILKHRYYSQLSEDVADRIWSLLGQCAHTVLERADVKNALQEERIFADMMGKQISGAADLYHNETISDYKVTTVWTAIKGNRRAEWTAQLNILAYLFGTLGFEVKALQVVAIYRDWSATEAARYADRYPPKAECLSMELWTKDTQMKFICERLMALIEAEDKTDDELPICSDEEMWAKADQWAVKKIGAQRSTKNCDSKEEAETVLASQKKPADYEIQLRSGEHTRCDKYCISSTFCSQHQAFKAATTTTGEAAQ